MRKGRKKQVHTKTPTAVRPESPLHFRLCHRCLFLNESNLEIESCQKCGSGFEPELDSTFEESESQIDRIWATDNQRDDQLEQEPEDSPFSALRRRTQKIVHGLKVRW